MIFESMQLKFEVGAIRSDGVEIALGCSTETVGDALMKAMAQAAALSDPEAILAVGLMGKLREVLGPGKTSS